MQGGKGAHSGDVGEERVRLGSILIQSTCINPTSSLLKTVHWRRKKVHKDHLISSGQSPRFNLRTNYHASITSNDQEQR